MYFLIKILISATVIAASSELAQRSSIAGAILISLPLTSILALCWLYYDTGDSAQVSRLSSGILWAVIPSLLFFWALPVLLRQGLKFPLALGVACAIMAGAYTLSTLWVKPR